MNSKAVFALILGALISAGTAVAHLSCLFLGPSCYEAQLAPPEMIQSAVDGTLLAPVANIIVSALFLICSLFALSAAGIIKRLPLLTLALVSIAGLCLVRGVATIPLSLLFPEMVSAFSLLAGVVWFVTGLLYFYGYRCLNKQEASQGNN